MCAHGNKQGRSAAGVVMLVVVVLLPVLYVLSIGPAEWLAAHGYCSEDAIGYAYGPVVLLYNISETAELVIDWYVELWR
jgi:hypothetical protein